MAHRRYNGGAIADLGKEMRKWRREGKSPKTYCSLGEYRAIRELFGKLVVSLPDGTEVRRHARIKSEARGGTPLVAHNQVIVGNPVEYRKWLAVRASGDVVTDTGWYPEWTYWPDSDFEKITVRTVLELFDRRDDQLVELGQLPDECKTSTVVALVEGLRWNPDVSVLPILADALQDAGYGDNAKLAVLRSVRC